jgi:hypothetical protein
VPNPEKTNWARYSERLPSCKLAAIEPTMPTVAEWGALLATLVERFRRFRCLGCARALRSFPAVLSLFMW